jgi:hypothetical protein
MARNRGLDPARTRDVRQIEMVACALHELLEVLKLRTPVSLPEGMDVVNVADNHGCLFGELRR